MYVRQEINCVLAVLQDQNKILRKLRVILMKGRLMTSPDFPQRREAYILQNCITSTSDRMHNFQALDERARGLSAFVSSLNIQDSEDPKLHLDQFGHYSTQCH